MSLPDLAAITARAEAIARDAVLDFYDAASPGEASALRLSSGRIGLIGLIALPEVGSTEFNRAVGFGEPLEKAALDEIVR